MNTAIEAIDLVKDYGNGENAVHALRGVNVAFEQGRFTAIMGPSGSGKSTLMHTLAGLDSATGGHIMFDGADITDAKGKDVKVTKRSEATYTFQMPEARSRWKLPLPRRERWWISLCSPT